MKIYFLLLISIHIFTILTKENISSTKTNYVKKTVKPNQEIKIENVNEEEGLFSSEKIHELNDITFDYTIRNGEIYRWFILFYSRSCGHCKRAKKEILKIFEDYKNISNLRFAEMEAYQNTMTNVRFNISGVPYMILIENKTILEMDLFPNYENLKDFILTNFSLVKDELKPLPKKVKFAYVAWLILKQTLDDITASFNKYLTNKGVKLQFNTVSFVTFIIGIIILICWGMIHICLIYCCNDEDIALEIQRMEEEFKRQRELQKAQRNENKTNIQQEDEEGEGAEYEIEEEEEDDEEGGEEGGEEKEKKKEMTEEEKKKKIEEEKEEEEKEEQEINIEPVNEIDDEDEDKDKKPKNE